MKLWLRKGERVVLRATDIDKRAIKKRFLQSQECQSQTVFETVRSDILGVLCRRGEVELTRLPLDRLVVSEVLAVLESECDIEAPEERFTEAYNRLIEAHVRTVRKS